MGRVDTWGVQSGKQPESVSTKTHHKEVVTTQRESGHAHIVKGYSMYVKIKISTKRIITVGRSTMTPVTIVYHSFIYHMYN